MNNAVWCVRMIDMTECFHFFIFHFFIVHTHSFTLMKGCVGDREENVAFPIFQLGCNPPYIRPAQNGGVFDISRWPKQDTIFGLHSWAVWVFRLMFSIRDNEINSKNTLFFPRIICSASRQTRGWPDRIKDGHETQYVYRMFQHIWEVLFASKPHNVSGTIRQVWKMHVVSSSEVAVVFVMPLYFIRYRLWIIQVF